MVEATCSGPTNPDSLEEVGVVVGRRGCAALGDYVVSLLAGARGLVVKTAAVV
jgi:hypothetical protein